MIDFEDDISSDKYKPHECTGCGETHTPNPPVKKHLDRQKILMLRRAADHVIATGKNDFKKSELGLSDFGQSAYGNFPALARYGLVIMMRDKVTKMPIRGHWLIPKLGWQFLRGERPVKSWVVVKDKHVQHEYGYGPEKFIKQIYAEADTIQTSFEYFDDDGNMIAVRPFAPTPTEQPTLFGMPIADIKPTKGRRELA